MNKQLVFDGDGFEDYLYWQTQDKKTLGKLNKLIKDAERNGYIGLGKPEALSGDFAGWWSREIDEKNRLIYRIKDGRLEIAKCKGHYNDK